MRSTAASALAWLLLFGPACSGPVETMVTVFDAGFPPGTAPDAEPAPDALTGDAQPMDGAEPDAGLVADSGEDGGAPNDGDLPDAEPEDAEPEDAEPADAEPFDAEPADVGDAAPDSGEPPDTGFAPDATPFLPAPTGFTPSTIDDGFRQGQSLSLVDIDADGDLDVIGNISRTDTIRLYLNGGNSAGGGNGSVWSTVIVAPPGSIVAMSTAVGDFDGDGDLDIAAVGLFMPVEPRMTTPGELTWYENPGNVAGAWIEHPVAIGVLYGPRYVVAADFTGDGALDLAIASTQMPDELGNFHGDGVYIAAWTGNTFAQPVLIDPLIEGVEQVAAADIDGDGVMDFVASGRFTDDLRWYENTRAPGVVDPNPAFLQHEIAAPYRSNGFALGQLDPDPAFELVVLYDDTLGGALVRYDAPADPRDPWVSSVIDPALAGGDDGARVAMADLNRDGHLDLAVSSNITDVVVTYIRTATGWQTLPVTALNGASFVAAGDLDGDLYPDLVTSTFENTPTSDAFVWWRTVP